MDKINWFLGIYLGVWYRKLYYKLHKSNKWLWGIYGFLNDGKLKGTN